MAYYLFVGYLFSPDRRKTMRLINLSTGTCKTETTSSETFDGWVEELDGIIQTMCELGMQLGLENPKLKLKYPIIKSDRNPCFDRIYEIVGKRFGMTSEQVKDNIYIYTNNLFWGEQGAVRLEFMKRFNRIPSIEDVAMYMFVLLQNYPMMTSNKAWL